MTQPTTRIARLIAVACAVTAFSLGGPGPAARAQDAASGDAANGKRVYLANGSSRSTAAPGQGGAMQALVRHPAALGQRARGDD